MTSKSKQSVRRISKDSGMGKRRFGALCNTEGFASEQAALHCRDEPASKRVRFEARRPNSNDVKTTELYLEMFRSDLDKPKMWWSRAEREAITEDCQDEIECFRSENIDSVKHFNHVFDRCQKPPSQETTDYLENAKINLPTSIRGLEWGWAPSTILHRNAHIREVLNVQDQVRSLSPDIRDRVLSSRSLRSSRAGRVLARILAEGDERQCKDTPRTSTCRSKCRMMTR